MGLDTKFIKAWRSQSRTERQAFIDENIDLASSHVVAQHVEAYLFDILDAMDDPEYVAQWLREKGYDVVKK